MYDTFFVEIIILVWTKYYNRDLVGLFAEYVAPTIHGSSLLKSKRPGQKNIQNKSNSNKNKFIYQQVHK